VTYRGTVKNGVVVLDEPVRLNEGQRVTVEVQAEQGSAMAATEQGRELLKLAGFLHTGRRDGSVNHDHYMYGVPKRESNS
jgi:hypothetical protein